MEDSLVYREKILSASELRAYSLLHDFKLDKVIIPHVLQGNTIRMAEGIHPSRLELDIVQLFKNALSELYKVRSSQYTPGIYSFFASSLENDDVNIEQQYLQHLMIEQQRIFHQYGDHIEPIVAQTYSESSMQFTKWCKENLNSFTTEYVLLHGDLFIGNILLYRNEYKIIDLEFLRYGPKELEIAFLLCWDFISNPMLTMYAHYIISKNIDALLTAKIVNRSDVIAIVKGFMPLIVSLACIAASSNIYADSHIILDGCNGLWKDYIMLKNQEVSI